MRQDACGLLYTVAAWWRDVAGDGGRVVILPIIPFLLQCSMPLCYICPMKRISVFLTEQQIAALHAWSAATGLRFAELLRRIVDQALEAYHAQR